MLWPEEEPWGGRCACVTEACPADAGPLTSRRGSLKRSFEVEEVETPNSTPPRRVQTPLLRATVASSTQKFQDLGVKNSEPSARHVDSLSQRSPKASLRRVELSGPKAAEPVSRRTELSIDISSKQVENAGAIGPSRFGLKRAEVLGHKTPE
ncbi:septin 9, partial [Homo sapiens]